MKVYRDATDECPCCNGSGSVTVGEALTIRQQMARIEKLEAAMKSAVVIMGLKPEDQGPEKLRWLEQHFNTLFPKTP